MTHQCTRVTVSINTYLYPNFDAGPTGTQDFRALGHSKNLHRAAPEPFGGSEVPNPPEPYGGRDLVRRRRLRGKQNPYARAEAKAEPRNGSDAERDLHVTFADDRPPIFPRTGEG